MSQEGESFTTKESTELLQYIATNMATRADVLEIVNDVVNEVVGKSKTEIMDYVDKKDREYKGELNLAIQKVDKKADSIIDTLSESKVINSKKANSLKGFQASPV